jgi:3-hydroxyacyl-CoA dehydrogenase
MNVDNIRRITVIGAGRMGHGIGQEFALAGQEVYFFGRSEERLQQAKERVERNLRELTELGEKT